MGVHCFKTSAPKIASFASLHANAPALLSCFSFGYFFITSSTEISNSFFIADEGSAFIDVLVSGRGLSLLVGGELFGVGGDCREVEEHGSHDIIGGDCTRMGGDSIPDGEKLDEGVNGGGDWNGAGY